MLRGKKIAWSLDSSKFHVILLVWTHFHSCHCADPEVHDHVGLLPQVGANVCLWSEQKYEDLYAETKICLTFVGFHELWQQTETQLQGN